MGQRQVIVAYLAAAVLSASTPALAARFIDTNGVWSERYINMLSDQGVINAEQDGKFRPEQPVTRAVFAYWLVKVLGLDNQPVSSKASFADVAPTDWCYKPVEIVRQNNYISGYADGFRPNGLLQKAEALTIIARTLNTATPDEQAISQALSCYKDKNKIPVWARAGVAQCTTAGIIILPNAGLLAPTEMVTRGDIAAIVCKLNEFVTKQSIAQTTEEATAATAPSTPPTSTAPGYSTPSSQAASAGAPYSAPQGYGQPPPYAQSYGRTDPQYQGRIMEQRQYQSQPVPQPYQTAAPQQLPAYQAAPQFGGQPPQFAVPPPQQGQIPPPSYLQPGSAAVDVHRYPPAGYPPPGNVLQGRVAVVQAGTHLKAALKNSLDSGSTQPGEPVEATITAPVFSGGEEVIPAGSKLQGQVSSVVSAKRFHFGANGKVDIRFTAVETPDGRKFPLSASIDDTQLRLTGGTTAGRVGKGLITTGIGAGSGAALGTALGAIVGATGRGQVGRSTGMGAAFGTALGGGVGLVGAGVRKGSEVKIIAGTELPVQLDESLQITAAEPPPYAPSPYGQPAYADGGQNYPAAQPSGYPAPPDQYR